MCGQDCAFSGAAGIGDENRRLTNPANPLPQWPSVSFIQAPSVAASGRNTTPAARSAAQKCDDAENKTGGERECVKYDLGGESSDHCDDDPTDEIRNVERDPADDPHGVQEQGNRSYNLCRRVGDRGTDRGIPGDEQPVEPEVRDHGHQADDRENPLPPYPDQHA